MTDFHHSYDAAPTSVPSSPVLGSKLLGNKVPAESVSEAATRTARLEELRLALGAAKIPMSKRASVCEVPQNAADCQFVQGTTRCKLALCEDSCTQAHQHHHTHAKALAADAPLVYSRPSLTTAASPFPHSGSSTLAGSPADSVAPSATNSPQQQYRRASTFGFGLGSHRGSMALSGIHDLASSPPSPLSGSSTAQSSAANSPRERAAPVAMEYVLPVVEEDKSSMSDIARPSATAAAPAPAPSAAAAPSASASSSASVDTRPPHLVALERQYWKLRNHIVNLRDYAPGEAGINTSESRSRTDLAAAPREDFPDQVDCSWDPRSPQPPSPVEVDPEQLGRLTAVNLNQTDPSKPEIEYVIRPQH